MDRHKKVGSNNLENMATNLQSQSKNEQNRNQRSQMATVDIENYSFDQNRAAQKKNTARNQFEKSSIGKTLCRTGLCEHLAFSFLPLHSRAE